MQKLLEEEMRMLRKTDRKRRDRTKKTFSRKIKELVVEQTLAELHPSFNLI